MKKEYSTPEIIFDSFTLNESIATVNMNCTRNISNQYSGNCGLQFGNRVVFIVSANGCKFKVQDGSPMVDGLCYHVPTADNKVFNS
jgi:hypothetical protein